MKYQTSKGGGKGFKSESIGEKKGDLLRKEASVEGGEIEREVGRP